MRGIILRKILVALIMIAPVFTVTDCRKQEKCGCDGDALFTLNNVQANVYFDEDGSNIQFTTLSNRYDVYYFCNSTEMFPKLADAKTGDVLLISGQAYWDCMFMQQSSNYSYYNSMSKRYQVVVTDVVLDLYGKSSNPKAE